MKKWYIVQAISDYPEPDSVKEVPVRADNEYDAVRIVAQQLYKCTRVLNAYEYTGRYAVCVYSGAAWHPALNPVPSVNHYAFLEKLLDREYDHYYCGCRGWD